MKLQGKDFCNCQHALMLLDAVEAATQELEEGSYAAAHVVLSNAVEKHRIASNSYHELHLELDQVYHAE